MKTSHPTSADHRNLDQDPDGLRERQRKTPHVTVYATHTAGPTSCLPQVMASQNKAPCAVPSECLTRRHVAFLYAVEGMLFTQWPYYASEHVLSSTNLLAPVSLVAIGCLLCSYSTLAMHGTSSAAQECWQYTTAARKVASLVYYSSISFVVFVALCALLWSCVARRIVHSSPRAPYGATVLYTLDAVFVAYIVVIAVVRQAGFYVLVYAFYYVFLYMHAELNYVFRHFYFLALVPVLS